MPDTPNFIPTPKDDPVRAPKAPDTPHPTTPEPAPDPPEGYHPTDPRKEADEMDELVDDPGSIREHPPNVIV